MSQDRRSAEWFAEVAGREVGPITGSALRQLVAEGRVHAETPIRRGSSGPWRPAGEVKGLSPPPAPEPEPEPPPPPPEPEPGDEWDAEWNGAPAPPSYFGETETGEEEFADESPGTTFPPVAAEGGGRSAAGRGGKPAYNALRTYATVLRIVGYVIGGLAVAGLAVAVLMGLYAAIRVGGAGAFFGFLLTALASAVPALLGAFGLIVAAEFVNLAVNVADDVREIRVRTPRR